MQPTIVVPTGKKDMESLMMMVRCTSCVCVRACVCACVHACVVQVCHLVCSEYGLHMCVLVL